MDEIDYSLEMNIEDRVAQLRTNPLYAGMSDDMIRQMIMNEMPTQSTNTGEFTVPVINPYEMPSNTLNQIESKKVERFNLPMAPGAMQPTSLTKTLAKDVIGNNVIGPNFLGKAKDFLGIMPKASAAETAIQAGEIVGPSLADAGLQMSNMGSAVPIGTSGLKSALSKIGLGGGSGSGAALSGAVPFLAIGGLALAARAQRKKRRERRKQREAEQYAERQQQQKQDLIDANLEYYEQANKFTNPYGLK